MELLLHWNYFPLHHLHLIYITLLNASVCLPFLHCLICIFGGLFHFLFLFSKLMGSFMWNTNSIWKGIYAKKKQNWLSFYLFLNLISCKFVMAKEPSKLFEKKPLNFLVNGQESQKAYAFSDSQRYTSNWPLWRDYL